MFFWIIIFILLVLIIFVPILIGLSFDDEDDIDPRTGKER